MEIVVQRQSKPEIAADSLEANPADAKRPYVKPSLIEWGSITELTQGGGSGNQDYPGTGGTEGV